MEEYTFKHGNNFDIAVLDLHLHIKTGELW